MTTREGRHRTPDRRQQIRMREALRERFETIPVHVPRSEVEELGAEIGLEDPTEAARLFSTASGRLVEGSYVRRRPLDRRMGEESTKHQVLGRDVHRYSTSASTSQKTRRRQPYRRTPPQ